MASFPESDAPRRSAWSTPQLRSAGVHGTLAGGSGTSDNLASPETGAPTPGTPTPTPGGS